MKCELSSLFCKNVLNIFLIIPNIVLKQKPRNQESSWRRCRSLKFMFFLFCPSPLVFSLIFLLTQRQEQPWKWAREVRAALTWGKSIKQFFSSLRMSWPGRLVRSSSTNIPPPASCPSDRQYSGNQEKMSVTVRFLDRSSCLEKPK